MTGFFVSAIFVCLVEVSCLVLQKRASRFGRVSNNLETDYSFDRVATGLVVAQAIVALIVLLLAATLQLGPWSMAAIVLAYSAFRFGSAVQSRENEGLSRELRLSAAVSDPDKPAPRFALFFSGPHMLDPYHVTMWLEPLKSLGFPFLVVVQEAKHLSRIPKSDQYQTICLRGLPRNAPALPASVKAVFVANNGKRNFEFMKRHTSRPFIQLLHGDSDKPPSFHPTAKAYDYVFVAGQMGIDRYKENGVAIRPEAFRIVGRPQLSIKASPKKDYRTIVYMTTWAGDFEDMNFSSFPQAAEIVRQAAEQPNVGEVIFKPHPVSYKDPNWDKVRGEFDEVAKNAGIPVRWADRNESPFELYAKADVLISDISSTIIDYLYSGKPYLATNPQGFSAEQLKKFPSSAGGYLVDKDVGNVGELLTLALGDDPMAEKRDEVRHYAFGDLDRPAGVAFQEACWELIGRPENK